MENIEKIFPGIREIKDYKQIGLVRVIFNEGIPFDVDEQDEIATKIEKKYKKYFFTGDIDLICNDGCITSYLLYYQK